MIYYDFHIHSALSPCGDKDMTPNNMVNMASIIGLDAIAITDHNSVGNVRAAMKVGEQVGVKVLAGMEVETAEEIHVLTLYETIEAAEEVAKKVYAALPDIKNRPEIFGNQYYMDENDNIVGEEEKLLISPTSIQVEDLALLVKSVGGLVFPAHVDRHSYSILTNLGFIPENLIIDGIEISKKVGDVEAYIESRPDLKQYRYLRNSDAHYLTDIAEKDAFIAENSITELFKRRAK
ncbi:MAG: PHP domain-containing protein [Clostridia bacterium]|nr:PHP domain-containing protein [Clostridia bacterium]